MAESLQGYKAEVVRLKARLAALRSSAETQRQELLAALRVRANIFRVAAGLAYSLAECVPDPMEAADLGASQARRAAALTAYERMPKT